ncbi:MAG TPA: alpha/beta hydrolase-fold protein [Oligoflexia bacterium]|nr:alpha/beta hydrolase-fold protein [Oligoflexia bacterium]HMR25164.1 alpha/beta hydrolase-fold protein [Oligoflexia bacterium]
MHAPHIQQPIFNSTLLKKSLFNDPTQRYISVYLPPNYNEKSKDAYSCFYILAPWSSTGSLSIFPKNVFSPSLPQLLDQAILENKIKPCIVIFPNCESKLGHSQYINSPACGPYMDYLCDEIVPYIDRHYNTLASAQQRSIMGFSSGGFGALVTGMLRPDVFLNIASSAADSFYEYLYLNMIPRAQSVLEKYGSIDTFIQHYLNNPNPMSLLDRNEGETLLLLNICACFIPNKNNPPLYGDLFFDIATGAIKDDAWQKLLAWDPIRMIDHHQSNIKQWQHVILDAGKHDEYGLNLGHRQIAKKLKALNISLTHNEYPGRHSGHTYRYIERIKILQNIFYL